MYETGFWVLPALQGTSSAGLLTAAANTPIVLGGYQALGEASAFQKGLS